MRSNGSRSKAPTQRDVAKLARASQAAVSRVMLGKGYVAEEVRTRIEAAAKTLDYRPDPFARSLITGRSNIVAVVTANVVNPLFPFILDALTDALQGSGKNVLLFNAAQGQKIEDIIPEVLTYRVSGIIITTASLSTNVSELCDQAGVPVVYFHRYSTTDKAFSVSCDGYDGGAQAAGALIKAGCRNLAYLGGNKDSSPNFERRQGFVAAAEKVGVTPVLVKEASFDYDWGWEGTGQLFSTNPGIDGIFCGDDAIASGAIDRLRHSLGGLVPEGVSVIGFDDVPQASWAAYSLTTLQQPIDEMIDLSLSIIEAPDSYERRRYALKGKLIQRSTVR